jgi:hypothetical protein
MNSNSLFDPSIRYDEPLTIYTRDINAIGDVNATEGTVAASNIVYGANIYRLGTGDQYAEFLPLAQATGISAQVTPAGVNSGQVSISSIGGMVRKSHGLTQKPGFTTYQAYDYSFQIAITCTAPLVGTLSDIQLRVDCTSQVGATGVRHIGGSVGSVGQVLAGIAGSGTVIVGIDAAPGTDSGVKITLQPSASGGWNNGVGGTFSLLVNVFFTVVGPQLINF